MNVYDSQEGGKTSHIGGSESQIQQEGRAVSQYSTHRASLRVSRTLHCCVTLKARWPEGGGCLLCQSSKACLAIFVPLQGQFAVCDLSKGNVTWQELLTSEEHLGVSEDIGHSYSFRVYPFVIFKIDFPPCFLCFNLCCLWGFIYVSQQIFPCLRPFDASMAFHWKGGRDHTRENCQYKSGVWMQLWHLKLLLHLHLQTTSQCRYKLYKQYKLVT